MSEDKYTNEEWLATGEKLFGKDKLKWKFQCPACRNVASAEDFRQFKDQGASPDSAYSECIGRYTGGRKGPNKCDWAAYGFFGGPVIVETLGGNTIRAFRFYMEAL
jgi:hypothetical protein